MKLTNILLGLLVLLSLGQVYFLSQIPTHSLTAGDDIHAVSRQEMIHEKSPEVMPFSMSQTKHEFNKIPGGGQQKVYVTDPNDTKNIKLIQGHLMEIADAFQQGDFSMPKQLHGDDMPGVSYLEEHADTFAVEYIENDIGADIMYISDNQETISAIHERFDAQVHDHGDDVAYDCMDRGNAEDPCQNIPEGHPEDLRLIHNNCL